MTGREKKDVLTDSMFLFLSFKDVIKTENKYINERFTMGL